VINCNIIYKKFYSPPGIELWSLIPGFRRVIAFKKKFLKNYLIILSNISIYQTLNKYKRGRVDMLWNFLSTTIPYIRKSDYTRHTNQNKNTILVWWASGTVVCKLYRYLSAIMISSLNSNVILKRALKKIIMIEMLIILF